MQHPVCETSMETLTLVSGGDSVARYEGCGAVTRVSLLKALKLCCKNKDAKMLKSIHAAAVDSQQISNVRVASTLVDAYAKCSLMLDAQRVFNGMQQRDVVSWTALILGYADNGEERKAFELFSRMVDDGCAPNAVTFIAALKSCTRLAAKEDAKHVHGKYVKVLALQQGRFLHDKAVEYAFDSDLKVANTLMRMYVKCGCIENAWKVFECLSIGALNVVPWNVLVLGYAENGDGNAAVRLFAQMVSEGWPPNAVTFLAVVKACIVLAETEKEANVAGKMVKANSLERGLAIHGIIAQLEMVENAKLVSTLVDLYAKSGDMQSARRVFDSMEFRDLVSWNVLILGYADCGEGSKAVVSFHSMLREGFFPDSVSFVSIFKACCVLANQEPGKLVEGKLWKLTTLEKGLAFQQLAIDTGCNRNPYVANTLMGMHANCGSMLQAREIFNNIQGPDVASWNVLILGYADNGEGEEALKMFDNMDCPPDCVTFVGALKACGLVGDFSTGKSIHAEIRRRHAALDDVLLATALIDYYGKCWSMCDAQQVFDELRDKDCVAWTALLAGYSRHGDTDRVLDLFQTMQDERVRPNRVTFLCVLAACSHAGRIDMGMQVLESMPSYGVTPSNEHYTCVADMLGRANRLEDAVSLVQKMPVAPDGVIWRSVLASCVKWRNMELARLAFQSLLALNHKDGAAYVLMADMYRSMDMHQDLQALRDQDLTIVGAA